MNEHDASADLTRGRESARDVRSQQHGASAGSRATRLSSAVLCSFLVLRSTIKRLALDEAVQDLARGREITRGVRSPRHGASAGARAMDAARQSRAWRQTFVSR